MSLYVQESPTQGIPSIVFLHGVGTSGWMWHAQIAALPDFHCLNVDLPGHGKSAHVEWISFADTAVQVAELIRSRATNGCAHVVGLSLGGYITLILLERHADIVNRAIISGVTAAPMPNRKLLDPQLWMMSTLMRKRWHLNMQAKALHLSPYEQTAFVENFLAMSMHTYRRVAEEAIDFHVPSSLRRSNTPTLITAGGRESKIILQAVEAISTMMPNGHGLLAPGLRHGWNIEDPDLFNAMLRAWISDTPLPHGLQPIGGGTAPRQSRP